MDIYSLSRNFWDYSFENPDQIKPNHIAMYFFAIEHCNRLGWKEKFGFPTTMVMDAINIKSYNTFIKTLNELVEHGFITMVEKSKNQYSSNIIALSKKVKANNKALDKAMIKHNTKQVESTVQSIDSIDIHNTNTQINNDTIDTGKPDPLDFKLLLEFLNRKTGRKYKVVSDKVKNKLNNALKQGYKKEDIGRAINNAVKSQYHIDNNFQYLTLEFFSRPEKLDMYSNIESVEKHKKEIPWGLHSV